MRYAGLQRRFFAFLIDCIVMMGLYLLIGSIFGLSIFFQPLSLLPMFGLWWYGGIFLLSWIYFAGFESSHKQATIGKQLLGLKVVDIEGNRIGFWRASGRYFSKNLSKIFFFFSFLMMLFTKKKQAIHDKIASTLVLLIR